MIKQAGTRRPTLTDILTAVSTLNLMLQTFLQEVAYFMRRKLKSSNLKSYVKNISTRSSLLYEKKAQLSRTLDLMLKTFLHEVSYFTRRKLKSSLFHKKEYRLDFDHN
jgi:hypothetical protein